MNRMMNRPISLVLGLVGLVIGVLIGIFGHMWLGKAPSQQSTIQADVSKKDFAALEKQLSECQARAKKCAEQVTEKITCTTHEYTVKRGDTLSGISKSEYSNGNLYKHLFFVC